MEVLSEADQYDEQLEQRRDNEALARVRNNDELMSAILTLDAICEAITFDNAHHVAQMLAISTDLATPRALYEELKYWADTGRI